MEPEDFNGWRVSHMASVGLGHSIQPEYLNFFDVTTPLWAEFAERVIKENLVPHLMSYVAPKGHHKPGDIVARNVIRQREILNQIIMYLGIPMCSRRIMAHNYTFIGVRSVKLRNTQCSTAKAKKRTFERLSKEVADIGFGLDYQARHALYGMYEMFPKTSIVLPHENPYHILVSLMFPYHTHPWVYKECDIRTAHKSAVTRYRLLCA